MYIIIVCVHSLNVAFLLHAIVTHRGFCMYNIIVIEIKGNRQPCYFVGYIEPLHVNIQHGMCIEGWL